MTKENPVVAVCIPVYRDVYYKAVIGSAVLAASWTRHAPAGWSLKQAIQRGQPTDLNRNFMVRYALWDFSAEADSAGLPNGMSVAAADIIIFNDSDCFLPDHRDYIRLAEMLMTAPPDVGIIGVGLPMQAADGPPRPNVELRGFKLPSLDGNLHEVGGIGFGVVAIRAECFDRVAFPWFQFKQKAIDWKNVRPGDETDALAEGEDMGFCLRVREAGFRVLLATGIEGVHYYGREVTLRDCAGKKQETKS